MVSMPLLEEVWPTHYPLAAHSLPTTTMYLLLMTTMCLLLLLGCAYYYDVPTTSYSRLIAHRLLPTTYHVLHQLPATIPTKYRVLFHTNYLVLFLLSTWYYFTQLPGPIPTHLPVLTTHCLLPISLPTS